MGFASLGARLARRVGRLAKEARQLRDFRAAGADRRVVWILGAGFSQSLGAPLLAGLLTRASAHRINGMYPTELIDSRISLGVSLLYEAGAARVRNVTPFQAHWEHAEEFLERLSLSVTDPHERKDLLGFLARVPRRVDNEENNALTALRNAVYAEDGVKTLHECALKMLAAECRAFLRSLDPWEGSGATAAELIARERWHPYIRWAGGLTGNDCVITFNYDRVPDLLAQFSKHVCIPLPTTTDLIKDDERLCPVYKLHGSVDWVSTTQSGANHVAQATPIEAQRRSACERVLAIPGPAKQEMVFQRGALLRPLWDGASLRVVDADALVFVGYRVPATDSFTRRWLFDHLTAAVRRRSAGRMEPLKIYTVLGDDTGHRHSRRLKGLFERIGRETINLEQEPMSAEDFLAVFDRAEL